MRPAGGLPLRKRVSGIGGVFFRAEDPQALVEWYADPEGNRFELWEPPSLD